MSLGCQRKIDVDVLYCMCELIYNEVWFLSHSIWAK